jgi:hypothetical protein
MHLTKPFASIALSLACGLVLAGCGDTPTEPPFDAPDLTAAFANNGNGNGAPSGAHFNLNIVGMSKNKTADMTGSGGHVIFAKLWGKTKIWLCESGVDAGCDHLDPDNGFAVIDKNGTDSDGAMFALPNPDPDGDGITRYSVFARALGQPGNGANVTTCATGPGEDGILGNEDDEEICSVMILELQRDRGKSKFENVSAELLYIYADIDGDGTLQRVGLFDDSLLGYFWDYENQGLKLAQLRFYECPSTVPDPSSPTDPTTTGCFD